MVLKYVQFRYNFDEQKWTDAIEDLVTPILVDKFSQNPHLLEWLKSTEDRDLVEAAGPHDHVWGNGLKLSDANVFVSSRWTGDNKQGKMLMAVRRHLLSRHHPATPSPTTSYMNVSSDQVPSSQGFNTDTVNQSF